MSPNSSLSYNDTGSGLPLVLIHGFCESKELWKDFEEKFSADYRVITPDLPGFGASPLKRKEINMRYMAEAVHELLVSLNIEKCVMVGHSLGGYVTLAFAEKYENMLHGIGLFHSSAFPDSLEKKKSRNKTIEFIEKHGAEAFAASFVSPLFYPANRERLKSEIEFLTKIAASTSAESIIAATKAMRDRKNRTEVLKNIKAPVLFIIGEDDPAIPLDASLEMCDMPGRAVKHILSQTGHIGMYEKKEETLNIVGEFLRLFKG
jgi:pimeloyl-ACP methyl ester carboxylesterase